MCWVHRSTSWACVVLQQKHASDEQGWFVFVLIMFSNVVVSDDSWFEVQSGAKLPTFHPQKAIFVCYTKPIQSLSSKWHPVRIKPTNRLYDHDTKCFFPSKTRIKRNCVWSYSMVLRAVWNFQRWKGEPWKQLASGMVLALCPGSFDELQLDIWTRLRKCLCTEALKRQPLEDQGMRIWPWPAAAGGHPWVAVQRSANMYCPSRIDTHHAFKRHFRMRMK